MMKHHRKKLWLFTLILSQIIVVGCTNSPIVYDDEMDEPILLTLSSPHLTLLQLTDLHLTFGVDDKDQNTFSLIEELTEQTSPDLIVITGDMVMSTFGPLLFQTLINHMDSLGIPWTFVFGNHESDLNHYSAYLNRISSASNLYFQIGPQIEDGGYGNFIIRTTYDGEPFYHLYLMDSKNEDGSAVYDYDSLSTKQVEWYETHAAEDAVNGINSLVFMHIPLPQYNEYINHPLLDGVMGEDKVYSQGVDTGMFDAMVSHGVSKGIFVGHDHLSNFSFEMNGILLAYGHVTGYNAYGNNSRGGRIIEIDSNGILTSSLITE